MPKEWECGDVITADALNNIEQGIQQALNGGGTKKLLLYEGSVDFTSEYTNWVWAEVDIPFRELAFSENYVTDWTLVVDDEELTTRNDGQDPMIYIGVENPGDIAHVGENKIGCTFFSARFGSTSAFFVGGIHYIMLDKNVFSQGRHSVKLYKEIIV